MTRASSAATARYDVIRGLLLERGSVRSSDLVTLLGVSTMTIHRDLDALANRGWLRRIRGGATVQRSALFELNVRARMEENTRLKDTIAAAAFELVSMGDAVILDDSTTSLALAARLNETGPVTLITYFRSIVEQAIGNPDIDLIALGGQYHPSYDSYLGEITVQALESLHADIAFLSTSAVTADVCFHQVPQSIAVKRAMMKSSARSVLLLDHSKFAKRALHRFTAISDFDTVVVDEGVSAEDLAGLREAAVEVIVARDLTGDRSHAAHDSDPGQA